MVTGYKTRKKRLRGTTSPGPAGHPPLNRGKAAGEGKGSDGGAGAAATRETRKVYDVWYTPTVKDVYAQFKVAEQMLSRCTDPALDHVKRKVYEVEDLIWQFIED
jgi:hypothetical protein